MGATQAATPVKGREEDHPWEDLRQRPVTGEWVRAHVHMYWFASEKGTTPSDILKAFKPKDGG